MQPEKFSSTPLDSQQQGHMTHADTCVTQGNRTQLATAGCDASGLAQYSPAYRYPRAWSAPWFCVCARACFCVAVWFPMYVCCFLRGPDRSKARSRCRAEHREVEVIGHHLHARSAIKIMDALCRIKRERDLQDRC